MSFLEWEVKQGNIAHNYKHPPLHELCKIMNFDIKKALNLKMRPLREELDDQIYMLNGFLEIQTNGNELAFMAIAKINEKIDSLQKKLGYFRKLKAGIKKESTEEEVEKVFRQNYDVNIIKTIPIQRVLDLAGIPVERRRYFKRRNEKTPSSYIYEDSNTWTDFGDSNKSGDVIDLYQDIYGVSFINALKELNYLI